MSLLHNPAENAASAPDARGSEIQVESRPPAGTPAPSGVRAPLEIGGPAGLEPTRFGDWERNGRCIDF